MKFHLLICPSRPTAFLLADAPPGHQAGLQGWATQPRGRVSPLSSSDVNEAPHGGQISPKWTASRTGIPAPSLQTPFSSQLTLVHFQFFFFFANLVISRLCYQVFLGFTDTAGSVIVFGTWFLFEWKCLCEMLLVCGVLLAAEMISTSISFQVPSSAVCALGNQRFSPAESTLLYP